MSGLGTGKINFGLPQSVVAYSGCLHKQKGWAQIVILELSQDISQELPTV